MQSMIRSIFVLFLLGFFTVTSAQLSPEIMKEMEKILALQKEHSLTLSYKPYFKDTIEQLLEKEKYKAALKMGEKALVLQKEHSLTFSPEFYFKNTIKKLLREKRYITLLNIMEKIIVLQKRTQPYILARIPLPVCTGCLFNRLVPDRS